MTYENLLTDNFISGFQASNGNPFQHLERSYFPLVSESEISEKRIRHHLRGDESQPIPGDPVPFSIELAESVRNYIASVLTEDMRFVIVPKGIWPDSIMGEMKRFMCSLEAYRQSPNPVIPIPSLLEGLTDKYYVRWLKLTKLHNFLKTGYAQFVEENQEILNTPLYPIKDIGDIFNYQYYFFWDLRDEVDDYKNSLIPEKKYSEYMIKRAYETAMDILPHRSEIDIIQEDEVLMDISSSTGLDSKRNKRPVFDIKGSGENSFSCEPLYGKRSIIPVCAGNFRDSLILPVNQSNSIKLIDRQLMEINKLIPYSVHRRDPEWLQRKLKKFWNESSYFYCRDLKKEGLTKPRQMIEIICRALKDKYPNTPFVRYLGIYKDLFLELETGETINCLRGHGLGMGNALTTIYQSLVTILVNRLHFEELGFELEYDACFWNDDSVFRFESESMIKEYIDYEEDILDRLSILRQSKKSFYLLGAFVFCENYYSTDYPNISRKTSYILNELFGLYARANITHAKFSAGVLSRNVLVNHLDSELIRLEEFYGHEFYPGERYTSRPFGGWVSPTYSGIQLDLIFNEDFSIEEYKAYMAIKKYPSLRKYSKRESNNNFKNYLEALYPNLSLPDRIRERTGYKQSRDQIYQKMSRFKDSKQEMHAWAQLLRLRKEEYRNQTFPYCSLTYEKKFSLLEEFYPYRDILFDPGRMHWISLQEPFNKELPYEEVSSINPVLSCLSHYNEREFMGRVIPEMDSFILGKKRYLSKSDRIALFKNIELQKGIHFFNPFYIETEEGTPIKEAFQYWWKPKEAFEFYKTVFQLYELPIYSEKRSEAYAKRIHFLSNRKHYLYTSRIHEYDSIDKVILKVEEALELGFEDIFYRTDFHPIEESDVESEPEYQTRPDIPENIINPPAGFEQYDFKDYWKWVYSSDRAIDPDLELAMQAIREAISLAKIYDNQREYHVEEWRIQKDLEDLSKTWRTRDSTRVSYYIIQILKESEIKCDNKYGLPLFCIDEEESLSSDDEGFFFFDEEQSSDQ